MPPFAHPHRNVSGAVALRFVPTGPESLIAHVGAGAAVLYPYRFVAGSQGTANGGAWILRGVMHELVSKNVFAAAAP